MATWGTHSNVAVEGLDSRTAVTFDVISLRFCNYKKKKYLNISNVVSILLSIVHVF